MSTATNADDNVQKHLNQLIAKEKRSRQVYRYKYWGSWLLLLLALATLFSGLTINLGFTTIKFIRLDPLFVQKYAPFIAQGAIQTIMISAASIALATILALFAALGRLSRNPLFVAISTFYVSLIMGTPLYLQVIFFFLALPQMGIFLSGFFAGVVALGLNYGAYMSEIFRAGIQSVGRGQHEAATALGMSGSQKMRLIVLPQALRFAIPPIGSQFIAMLKDSALVSATGFVRELLWRAQKVGRSNFRNLEALLIAALFYWIMTLIFSAVQTRIEARFSQGEKTN